MNKKLVLLGIPLVLALAGVAHAWALHRPKMQVPSDFGQPMMVVYPQTRYIGFDKYATYKVECALRECRELATILDTEGRMATVGVMGATTPLNLFSPDGKRVLINDLAHIYTFDGQAFSTQKREPWAWFPQGGSLTNNGAYHIVADSSYEAINGEPTEVVTVEMNGNGYQRFSQPLQGTVIACDDQIQVINRESPRTDPEILYSYYFNPETHSFDKGERVTAFESRIHDTYSCANDGKGTAYVLTEDNGGPAMNPSADLSATPDGAPTGKATNDSPRPRGAVIYRKAMHKAPEALSPEYTVGVDNLSVLAGGFQIGEHDAWVFNRDHQMVHFDYAKHTADISWKATIPDALASATFEPSNPVVTDHHVFMIGQTEESPTALYALVYEKETGDLALAKQLTDLEPNYRNTWIGHIDIRDEAAVVEWLKTQPDIEMN